MFQLLRCWIFGLIFLLVAQTRVSSQTPKVLIDTLRRLAFYDSGTINFDNSIVHIRHWLDILKADTVLFAYFQRERKTRVFELSVSRIDTISAGAMIYRFRVVYHPKLTAPVKDIGKALLGQIGATYFYIRLERLLYSGRLSIAEVRFDGIEI